MELCEGMTTEDIQKLYDWFKAILIKHQGHQNREGINRIQGVVDILGRVLREGKR